jgi:hypothetical protein
VVVKFGSEGQYSKKAHRLVLCSASPFFDNALFKNNFKVSRPRTTSALGSITDIIKENGEGVITLPIDDKEVAEIVLACIYGASYNDQGRTTDALYFNTAVYAAADYLGLNTIIRLARDKFQAAAEDSLRTPPGCALFISAAQHAYDHTQTNDKVLRALIADLCVKHKAVLFANPKFKPALWETAELATDISYAFSSMHRPAAAHSQYVQYTGSPF